MLQRHLDRLIQEVQRLVTERDALLDLSNELRAQLDEVSTSPKEAYTLQKESKSLIKSLRPPKSLADRALLVKQQNTPLKKAIRNYNDRD